MSETQPWRDKDLLEQLYVEEERATAEIGELLGCSDTTVQNWLDRFEISRPEPPYKNEDLLRQLYVDERLTVHEIGDRLGCDGTTISNWLKKFEIERREGRKDYGHDEFPWRDEDTIRSLYEGEKLTIAEIADRLGCDNTTISKWLQHHGIESRAVAKRPPYFLTDANGYERWDHQHYGKRYHVKVHRLLAVSEHGFDAVIDMDVHHQNSIPWDNRPENIELMTHSEHAAHHGRIRGGSA